MDPVGLLDGLDAAQAEAVTTPEAPLCIVAGAGSGKTRVLTRRIAHRIATGSADPRHVLVLTFTRKAALELVGRLAAFGFRDHVSAGTFHAMAFAHLRQRWAEQRRPTPVLLERRGRLLAPLLAGTGAPLGEVLAELDWAGARLVTPPEYPEAARRAGRQPPLGPDRLAEVLAEYEALKRRRGVVDFDDLLALLTREIEQDPTYADQVRWRVRHLFVDEYQDVNPRQHRLLEAWRGGRDDLCVVGDPAQAIYGWNGADVRFLTRFADRHPNARVVHLTTTYRSTPEVLAVARTVLGTPIGAAPPEAPTLLRARRPTGPLPTVHVCEDEHDEAGRVAELLRAARRPGRDWGQLAVLARTRAQCEALRTALERAGVPSVLPTARSWMEQPDARAALGRLTDPDDPRPLAVRLADLELHLEPGETGSVPSRAVTDLLRLAHEYVATDASAPPSGLAPWLAAGGDVGGPPSGADAVEVATFHAAKGLEWPVVVLAGLERGYVPIAHAATAAALVEERNLLYVAATRATHELHLTWARHRRFRDRVVGRDPSPFLAPIAEVLRTMATRHRTPSSSSWRSSMAEVRQSLRRHAGTADPEEARAASALARLEAWRHAEARAAGVEPAAVLSDDALTELVRRRPTEPAELARLDGLGPLRAGRYGDRILSLLHDPGPTP